jgi:hypothetical protein
MQAKRGYQGRIQDFKLGGAYFKKLRRAEGGANIFGVFHVKNHHFSFYTKYRQYKFSKLVKVVTRAKAKYSINR